MYSKERHRLRGIWKGMIARCTNPNNPMYKRYGGRGIKVDSRWLNSFECFYNWAVNNGHNTELSIDRINVNDDYKPSNCRWATCREQSNNKTNNRVIKYRGVEKTVSEWASESMVPYMIFYRRIFYDNWPFEKALSEPKGTKFNKNWVIDKNEPYIDNRVKKQSQD